MGQVYRNSKVSNFSTDITPLPPQADDRFKYHCKVIREDSGQRIQQLQPRGMLQMPVDISYIAEENLVNPFWIYPPNRI